MTQIESPRVVETTHYPSFFGSFEIKDCWDSMGPTVITALDTVIQGCTQPGSREHRKALYMHDNQAGNLFTLSFGLCEVERLCFVVEYLNFLTIIDDVLEDYPQRASLTEHEILGQVLRSDPASMSTISATPNTRMEWINYLRDLKTRMMKVDPVRTPSLLQRLEKDMRDRESSAAEFDTMEQYLPFRLKNFDFEAVSQMLLWGMDIDLSFAELESDLLAKIKYSSGIIAVLANDYFSWEREKRQQYDSDRIRNGVAVLMKQDDVSEEEAKEGVKKIIIEEEGRIRNLLAVAQETGKVSEALRRYLDGLQSFASGYQFWCATCPRYSMPEGDSN